MMFALVLCLIAQAPAPLLPPRIESPVEQRAFTRTHEALLDNPSLLAEYRGLRQRLAEDGALRQAEENYQALMELPGLRARVDDFEEVLRVDGGSRAIFDRYVARVRRDPALRETIDRILLAESNLGRGREELKGAFVYLRVHPEVAEGFFAGPAAGAPRVDTLEPLRDAVRRDRELSAALRDAWVALDAQAGAREAVYPWWALAYGASGAVARAWQRLDREWMSFPSRRRAWEDRELAWSGHPQAVLWRDHFYARVRRDAALSADFFSYLRSVRSRPEVEAYAERSFVLASKTVPPWPPVEAPSALAAWIPREAGGRPKAPGAPVLRRPARPGADAVRSPTLRRPAAPSRPRVPERVEKPAAPDEPEARPF